MSPHPDRLSRGMAAALVSVFDGHLSTPMEFPCHSILLPAAPRPPTPVRTCHIRAIA